MTYAVRQSLTALCCGTAAFLKMTVEQILANLVAIDSVSSRSNAEIISYLQTRCAKFGFETKTLSHLDENGIEKINLVAFTSAPESKSPSPLSSGDAPQIELALVGHTDTVPYDSNWIEALTLTEKDGKLFGEGTIMWMSFD